MPCDALILMDPPRVDDPIHGLRRVSTRHDGIERRRLRCDAPVTLEGAALVRPRSASLRSRLDILGLDLVTDANDEA